MNVQYVLYDNNGKIETTGACPEHMVQAQDGLQGLSVLEGEGRPETQYVDILQDPPVIADRLPFPGTQNTSQIQANGTDEWVVLNIPVGSIVTWPDGVISTINDGILQFTVDLAGTYSFVFDSFPYLLEEVSIEAVT